MSVYNIINPSTDQIYYQYMPTSGSTTVVSNPMIDDLDAADFKITNLADPVDDLDAANKQYVDAQVSNIQANLTSVATTTANLSADYDNGSSGSGATLTNNGAQAQLVLDGVTLVNGNQVLIKNQSTQAQNGVYMVTDQGSGSSDWILTRSDSYDEPSNINNAGLIAVTEGTVNAGSIFAQTDVVVTVGTSAINFILFSNSSLYLTKASNLSDVANIATSIANLSLTIGTNTQAWSATLDAVSAGTYTGASSITTLAHYSDSGSLITISEPLTSGSNSISSSYVPDSGNILTNKTYVDNQVSGAINVTGPITISNNVSSITAQTGTGTEFVVSASPTLTGTVALPIVNVSGVQTNSDQLVVNCANSSIVPVQINSTGSGHHILEVNDNDSPNKTFYVDNGCAVYADGTVTCASNFVSNSGTSTFSIVGVENGLAVYGNTQLGSDNSDTITANTQINMTSNKIINLDLCTNPNDAANKQYVDDVVAGLNIKESCLAASTVNIDDLVYYNGPDDDGIGATLENTLGPYSAFSLDGQAGVLDGRYLIKNQTTTTVNGVYTLTAVGSSVVPFELTRATDSDHPDQLNGALVPILYGSTNAGNMYLETAVITAIGTDPITYSLFSGPSVYLQKANNLSDVTSASTSRTNLGLAIGSDVQAHSSTLDAVSAGTYTGASSITTLGTIASGTWQAGTVAVSYGGTGANSYTAYAPVIAGTTSTGSLQSASTGLSTSGFVLTSNGASALPSFQDAGHAGVYLPLAGGTMAGNIAMGNNDITGVDALTVDGIATLNGNVVLGDASGDSLTINAGTSSIVNNHAVTLNDNSATSLSIGSTGATNMLVFDTTDSSENITVGNNFNVTGNSVFNGNTTIGNASGDALTINAGTTNIVNNQAVTLIDNSASALSFGSAGASGILALDTTDSAEKVTMSKALSVTGVTNLTTDLNINTDKFNVTGSNGNTLVAGTLGVTGTTSLNGNVVLGDASGDSLTINAGTSSVVNNHTVTLNDNSATSLSLGSTGATNMLVFDTTDSAEKITMSKDLSVTGAQTLTGNTNIQSIAYNASSVTTGSIIDVSGATSSIILPNGTNAQQPSPVAGMMRYNTDTDTFEGVSGVSPAWGAIGGSVSGPTYTTDTKSYTSYGLFQPPGQQISASSITGTPANMIALCQTTDYLIMSDRGTSAFIWLFTNVAGTWGFAARYATTYATNQAKCVGNQVVIMSTDGVSASIVQEWLFTAGSPGSLSNVRNIINAPGDLFAGLDFIANYVAFYRMTGNNVYIYKFDGSSTWSQLTGSGFATGFTVGNYSDITLCSSPLQLITADVGASSTYRCYAITAGSPGSINTTPVQTISLTANTPTGFNSYSSAQCYYDNTDVSYTYLHFAATQANCGGTNLGGMLSYEWNGSTWTFRNSFTLGQSNGDYAGWGVVSPTYYGTKGGLSFYDNTMLVLTEPNALLQFDLVKSASSPYITCTFASTFYPSGSNFSYNTNIVQSVAGDYFSIYSNNGASPEYINIFGPRTSSSTTDVDYQETVDNIECSGNLYCNGDFIRLPVTSAGDIQSLVPAVMDGLFFIDSVTGTLRYLFNNTWQTLAFGSTTGGVGALGYVPNSGDLSLNGRLLNVTGLLGFASTGGAPIVGNATLIAGTVTVSTTAVTANSIIMLTPKTSGGTIGTYTYTISAGTSFTINSSNVLDISTISWFIVN